MTEYKSKVHVSPAPQQRVYDRLSDLSILTSIKDSINNPEARQRMLDMAEGKVSAEQLNTFVDKIQQLEIDSDSVSGDSPLGRITLRIVEREEPKCIKFELEGAPIQANLWIQLLPLSPAQSKLKVTVGAEVNFFMKGLVAKPLQQAADGLANMLAALR